MNKLYVCTIIYDSMSISKTETYYLHSRYANAYNSQTKTFTFHLNETIQNAVSLKIKQFYLNFINNDLFEDVYENNGYRTYDLSKNKLTRINLKSNEFKKANYNASDFSNDRLMIEPTQLQLESVVVFNNKNNDIAKALGFRNHSYTVKDEKIVADGHIAKSLHKLQDKYDFSFNSVLYEAQQYDDMHNIYISLNDYCHTLNKQQIHMNTNEVSKYIIDKAVYTTDEKKYTLDETSERNTRHYDKISNIRTVQVQLLHETGTPLNLDNHEFNFTIEVEVL